MGEGHEEDEGPLTCQGGLWMSTNHRRGSANAAKGTRKQSRFELRSDSLSGGAAALLRGRLNQLLQKVTEKHHAIQNCDVHKVVPASSSSGGRIGGRLSFGKHEQPSTRCCREPQSAVTALDPSGKEATTDSVPLSNTYCLSL